MKHLQSTILVCLAMAFCTFTFAQNNAVYPDNSGVPGFQNSLVGFNTGNALNNSSKYNTFTGGLAGFDVVNSAANTYDGHNAGRNHEGEVNSFFGYEAGALTGTKTSGASTYIGALAGSGTFGNRNVFLGFRAGAGLADVDNQLYIAVSTGTPLIYGNFADQVAGINTTAPLSTFDVRGTNLLVTDPGTTAANFINNRATGLGQSGGPGGPAPCDLYGFRSQTDINNSINVGMDAKIPTILWESTADDLTFAVRNPSTSSTCSTRLLRLGADIGGSGYQLIFDGAGRVNGSWSVFSDKRLKKDVEVIPNALDLVKQLNGVTYTYDTDRNPDMILPQGKVYGFIAQDVKAVIPEVTSTSKEDGLIGIKYTEIIPLLTEGIKEQQEVIESQEEVIAEQQNQLDAQNDKIATLEARLAAIEQSLSATSNTETAAEQVFKSVKLSQNRPNPFSDITTIEYELPADVMNATLDVFTMDGTLVQSFDIQSGEGMVELDARSMGSGTYVYAINVDGANVATNIMIVQK